MVEYMLALDDGALSHLANVGNYTKAFMKGWKQGNNEQAFQHFVYYNIKNNTYISLVKIAWFGSLLLHLFLNTLVTGGTPHEIVTNS